MVKSKPETNIYPLDDKRHPKKHGCFDLTINGHPFMRNGVSSIRYHIWSSKNLCSGGTALPVILSSNDRCVFGFFSNLPPVFFRVSVCLRRIFPRMTYSHRRHIIGGSSVFFKLASPKELAIRKTASWKKECSRHAPVGRHFDLGAYISQIARTGDRPCDPCRDLAEIHPDKHAEQDDAGALGGSEEAVRFRMMSKTGGRE